MNSTRNALLMPVMALALAWAAPAKADTILFNPTGGGLAGAIAIDALDQSPGNGLGVGINTSSPTPTNFSFLYQANLANADLSGIHVVPGNGTGAAGGRFFTFAADFGETLTGIVPNFPAAGNATLGFAFNPSSPTNFFDMYVNTTGPGSDLSGLGFVTGTKILSGVAIPKDFSDVFTFSSLNPASAVALDQAGINNYPTINSLVGNGQAAIDVQVTFADPNYFPNLVSGSTLVLGITSTTEKLPFNTADPSACFSTDGVTQCNQAGATVASVGTINGSNGPNTLLQADASTSFTVTQVPEPTSLALLGGGLLFLGRTWRRKGTHSI